MSDNSIYWGTIGITINSNQNPNTYSLVLPTKDSAGFGIIATPPPYNIWYPSGKITNKNLLDLINSHTPLSDPYEGGGASGTGGGTGNLDGTGDDIDFPSLPSLSAVDTGFITIFNPTIGQLKNLANYLWGDAFDLSTWKKIFADPMDAILGMSIVPVAVPNGSVSEVTVGNIGTGVSMTKAGAQYVEIDCHHSRG